MFDSLLLLRSIFFVANSLLLRSDYVAASLMLLRSVLLVAASFLLLSDYVVASLLRRVSSSPAVASTLLFQQQSRLNLFCLKGNVFFSDLTSSLRSNFFFFSDLTSFSRSNLFWFTDLTLGYIFSARCPRRRILMHGLRHNSVTHCMSILLSVLGVSQGFNVHAIHHRLQCQPLSLPLIILIL